MTRLVVGAGVVVVLLILAPAVILSEPLTTATLAPIPVILLIVGLVVRRQPDPRSRSIGSAVIVLAVMAFVALAALYAIALGGTGRI